MGKPAVAIALTLDRTQPLLPIRAPDRPNAAATTTRATARCRCSPLDTATGRAIGRCSARHRAREFRAFLNIIEANVPDALDVHIVIDNLASHKTQAIGNWFAKKEERASTPRTHLYGPPPGVRLQVDGTPSRSRDREKFDLIEMSLGSTGSGPTMAEAGRALPTSRHG